MNMVRNMLKGKHLPNELWGERVSTITYLLNISVHLPNGYQICVLNGLLEEEMYVATLPDSLYKKLESKFYRLRKALYGLKKASRACNKIIDGFLKEIGFNKYVCEYGLYVKNDTSKGVIILCLYVNDLLITGNNEGYIIEFNPNLMKEFEMSDFGVMI